MSKLKPVAIAMVFVMLMPLLSSCSSSIKKYTVVKADDPWYESVKFEIKEDIHSYEMSGLSSMCAGDDRLYNMYCATKDRWGSSRTVLDIYDLDGNLLSRKEVSIPGERCLIAINSISASPDGKTLNAIVGYLGTDMNGPVFTSINTETGKLSNVKEAYSKKAKRVLKRDVSVTDVKYVGDYAVALLENGMPAGHVLDWQLLLYKNSEFVAEMDLSSLSLGYFLRSFSIDETTNSLYASAYEDDVLVSMEFDLKSGRLKDKRSFTETADNKVNLAEYTATDTGDLCKIDSYGNILKIDINDMTPKTVIDTNWYTPYFSSTYSDDHIGASSIISCNEERTIIGESSSTIYSSEYNVTRGYVRVLKKAEKNPHAGKKVLKLALPPNSGVSEYLSRSIYEFNQSSSEYLIRLWDKYKTGYNLMVNSDTYKEDEKQIFTMIQDLKGGDAPDLIIGIQKKYAMRDDIFMDLSDMLDPEVMEKQYKNVFDASKVDGKLFFLPVTLTIEGLVTNTELLKEGAVGITFEEFDKIIKEKMNGFSPYDYPGSSAYNKRDFILSCIDTKSAVEGSKIDFGTEQFRTAVQYAKKNFNYDDEKSIPNNYKYDFNRYRGECYYAKIDDYLDYVHACFREKGKYSIIGTPSVDASGPRFKAVETISVSASTGEKDGCKKFLNYLFAGTAYDSAEPDFRLIVTNREIMEKDTLAVAKLNNIGYERFMGEVESGLSIPAVGLDKATGDKMATDEMRVIFLKSLSDLNTYYYEDKEITKFVFEEIAPFFTGDHTLDEAVTVLNDRATKYIREL